MLEVARKRVETQTAVYELDLVSNKVRRLPKGEPADDYFIVQPNRQDGEWMELVALSEITVGRSMILFVMIPETPPDHVTTRVSTPVLKIEDMA